MGSGCAAGSASADAKAHVASSGKEVKIDRMIGYDAKEEVLCSSGWSGEDGDGSQDAQPKR
jgi:hypothetical protein